MKGRISSKGTQAGRVAVAGWPTATTAAPRATIPRGDGAEPAQYWNAAAPGARSPRAAQRRSGLAVQRVRALRRRRRGRQWRRRRLLRRRRRPRWRRRLVQRGRKTLRRGVEGGDGRIAITYGARVTPPSRRRRRPLRWTNAPTSPSRRRARSDEEGQRWRRAVRRGAGRPRPTGLWW